MGEVQPFRDNSDDLLGVVSSTCLALTLTVGLALKVPSEDPTVQWILDIIALIVGIVVMVLGAWQLALDLYDELLEMVEDARDAKSGCCGCFQALPRCCCCHEQKEEEDHGQRKGESQRGRRKPRCPEAHRGLSTSVRNCASLISSSFVDGRAIQE